MNKNKKSSIKLAIFVTIVFGLWPFFNIGKASAEVTAGLVGQYKFNEGSGTSFADSSGNNSPGTCSGSGCPSYVAGKLGTALQFDGTDDYISYGNVPGLKIFPGGNWSVSAWIKPTGSSTYTEGIIFMGDYQIPGIWYETQRNSILMDMRRTNGTIDWIARTNQGTILPGGWHHLVVTANQTNYQIYLDGIQSTSVPYEAMYASAASAYVSGGRNDTYGHYNGAIDDVRVYNRSLTQAEITSLANPALVAPIQRLRVSDNDRFLVKEDGTPFFWMGDTAWSIATIRREDVDFYLNDRVNKGFNLIHIDADAYGADSYYGQRPFLNNNSDTPNSNWWNYVDEIITKAEDKGLYVCIFTMWSQIWDPTKPPGQQYYGGYNIFGGSTTKAYNFGKWIGDRYKNRSNVIWSVAGEYDKMPDSATNLFEAVAQGLEDAHLGSQIMTIHPASIRDDSSSEKYHNSAWLDFNMLQTSHTANLPTETYEVIEHDYNLLTSDPVNYPVPIYKPTLEGESLYEGTDTTKTAAVRRKLYWSVFAGGFGVTYGNFCVQDMNNGLESVCNDSVWKTALNSPVATQVRHLRNLMESLPDPLNRIPDQNLILSPNADDPTHVRATRDSNGTYALIYIPYGAPVTVDMSKINSNNEEASWYNPQTGEYTVIPNVTSNIFDPPGSPAEGNDWVLVLKQEGSTAQCFDGADNDSDGKIDFGYGPTNDPGCTHYGDDDENGDPAPETGLVARWTMDANHINDNIVFDSSTSNNHGSTNGTADAAGKIGQARLFNGTSNSINVSHDTTLANSSGTYTAWFKIDDLTKKSQAIFGKDANGCTGDCGHFYIAYNDEYYSTHAPYVPDKLFVRFQNNGTSYFLYSNDTLKQVQANTWHHVAVTFGTGGLKLYLDGILHDTDAHSEGMAGNSENLSIGNYYEANYGLKGALDDVRIYNRVLTEAEINNLPGFSNPADVNNDNHVNIKDIQICVKGIIDQNSIPSGQLQKCQAVALPIETVNIKDIQAIIRAIVNPS